MSYLIHVVIYIFWIHKNKSIARNDWRLRLGSLVWTQTLYKTQVRELKEECEDRNKLSKDAQQSLQDLQEERWERSTHMHTSSASKLLL